MEDLYGDLNNYDDVNAIQELRNENKELKVKLEEHAAAMERLQKDYDTLEMEFKKLENNYSSLLKTARSELERKTQRITQLNMEKDMMVIDALKNGKYVSRTCNKSVQNPSNSTEKPNKAKLNEKLKENEKQKNVEVNRYETNVLPAKDMVPNSGTYNKSNYVNKYEKRNFKENVSHHKTEYNDNQTKPASSIKDRRKSMPAVSMPIEKFSSDEEFEQNLNTKDTRTELPPIDKLENRNTNRMPIDRHSNKTSETSSVDDKGTNHYESSLKDYGRERSGRHYDNKAYRGRNKYEVSLKYRKQYSPDRGHKRHKEYQDDYNRREQGRYRTLESPPPESHSRYQRRNSDHRSYNQKYSYDHDHEKYRHRHEEKYAPKHKVANDYDEPQTKRQRTDSFGNPDAYYKEDRRYYNNKVDTRSVDFSPHEHDMMRLSCQSPDSVHTDAAFTNPKEIMATATTPLEDPRLTSKRYVIKQENGKEILSSAVGRNIDIKFIDKSKWNIIPVGVPRALVRRPSQCSDDLVKDIYMDIDNPVSNMSLESGELYCESDHENEEIRSKVKETQAKIKDFKTGHQVAEVLRLKQLTNTEQVSKPDTNTVKCRIPKIGQKNKTPKNMNVPIIELGETINPNKNAGKRGVADNNFARKPFTRKQQNEGNDDLLPGNISYCKKEDKGEKQQQIATIGDVTLRDDLELSDDNSDHADIRRPVVTEKDNHCEIQKNSTHATIDDSVSNIENKSCNIITPNSKSVNITEIKTTVEMEKGKEPDSHKKQKPKKKKSKEISKELVETTDAVDAPDKKMKSKKEKDCKTKETKEKFSDLFGDSCSLMTPEDLGLPSYLPITEDTQDAVDLKISQIIDAPQLIDKKEMAPVPSADDSYLHNRKENKLENKIYDKSSEDVLQESNTNVKIVKDVKKKRSSKKKDDTVENDQIPPADLYENLNPGTDSNDANVVKTVIISTGVQPVLIENKLEEPNKDAEVEIKAMTADIMEFKRQLQAFQTSTPHKEFSTLDTLESDAKATESIYDSQSSKMTAVKDNAEVGTPTDTKTLESQDAPDVRIFVKRRRKLVKRPPMT